MVNKLLFFFLLFSGFDLQPDANVTIFNSMRGTAGLKFILFFYGLFRRVCCCFFCITECRRQSHLHIQMRVAVQHRW